MHTKSAMRTEVLSLLGPGSHLCASVTCSVLSALGRPHPRRRVSTGGRRLLGLLALAVLLLAHMWLPLIFAVMQIRAHASFDMYSMQHVM